MSERQRPLTPNQTPQVASGPSCAPQTPAQKELSDTLGKLRQEKFELEAVLSGEVCTLDPVQQDLENSKKNYEEVTGAMKSLKATREALEVEIRRLEKKTAERIQALDTLAEYVSTVKGKLQEAISHATKELQLETQRRISVQENFFLARRNLQQCQLMPPSTNNDEDGQGYAYPYDATIERPARYVRNHLRKNPLNTIPFPNDAMDEAETLGHETQ